MNDLNRALADHGASSDEVLQSMHNALEHAARNAMLDEEVLAWVWKAGAVYEREHGVLLKEAADKIEGVTDNPWIYNSDRALMGQVIRYLREPTDTNLQELRWELEHHGG